MVQSRAAETPDGDDDSATNKKAEACDFSSLSVEEKAVRLYAGEALAPMVRASTIPLRSLALKYGADFCYTEELIDRSISSTIRVENKVKNTVDFVKDSSRLSKKQQRRLQQKNESPALILQVDPKLEARRLVCQLGTGEPQLALTAAMHVHRDVSAIDINMGCVSGGMGSALLSDPDRSCRIIRTLTEHMTPRGLPVSCKIRLLRDAGSTLEFITALIGAGAKAVAIHGRRVGHEATEKADWETLREVVSLAKSKFPAVPILINGDFYTRQEFTDFMAETGANGVLLARPALYNTSIFRKPLAMSIVENSSASSLSYGYASSLLLDKTEVVQDYVREAVKYNTHYKNVKYVIAEMMNNRRTPTERVPCLPHKFARDHTISNTCACKSLQDICKVWNVDYQNSERRSTKEDGGNEISKDQPIQMAAGEHKYSDSYFLGINDNKSNSVKKHKEEEECLKETTTNGNDPSSPPLKRVRVSPSQNVVIETTKE